MKFKDKVVIITGGARDIGRAVSLDLANHGAKLAINYFGSEDQAQSLNQELKNNNSDAFILKGDMTNKDDVVALVEKTISHYGNEIHGLVNISGGLVQRKKIDENMTSGSSIVNFASQAGRDGGGPGASAYAASKGAVITFTRSMAKELGQQGIRVNSLCPGMIATTFHDTFTKDEVRSNVANATPLKREGRPDEMATTVSFLLSDESSFLTGVNLDTNGGLVFS